MIIESVSTLTDLEICAVGLMLFKDYDRNLVPQEIQVQLDRLIDKKVFDLSSGKARVFNASDKTYIIVGLGNALEDLDLDDLRTCSSELIKMANSEKVENLALVIQHNHIEPHHALCAVAEMAVFASYQFSHYQQDSKPPSMKTLYIVDENADETHAAGIFEGLALGESTSIARSLVDEPACVIYPETLANRAVEYGETFGFEVEVKEESEIATLGLSAFLAVAKGSSKSPKLIVMRYKGQPESDQIEGWVGKGLTYDAGGMSIKSADGMEHMKTDMAGAAAVIGAMVAVAKARLPINVTAVVAACENMISGDSYKPGDILTTMAGKTIYIGNTDAEGRLTLVDAITYIVRNEGVSSVVDLATLTGAAIMALGNVSALSVSNDDDFYSKYDHAAKQAGEKVWRMPAFKEYEKSIKHHEADFTNMGGKPGSITAALVLREFTEGKPWIHVDIAGVAHYTAPLGYYPKGASGYGVKTLYQLAKISSHVENA